MALARSVAVLLLLVATVSAGLLDIFTWDDDEVDTVQRDGASETSAFERNCTCEGVACSCCMDLSTTFLDLGGPGCVLMKYMSPAEGIAVNISYGENLLLSEAVKGANPQPACLNMLSDLAQMCARFSDLAATSDGLRWCLQLEPMLLGEAQTQYQLGCFRMGPQGMVPDPPSNASLPAATPLPAKPSSEVQTAEQLSEEELIAAVNDSAEEGIAFFSNLLGLNFGGSEQANSTETDASSDNSTTAVPFTNQETTVPAQE